MTTMMEYAMVRLAVRGLDNRFDPTAAPVEPTAWERFRTRVRNLI